LRDQGDAWAQIDLAVGSASVSDLTVQNQLAGDLDGGGNSLSNVGAVETGNLTSKINSQAYQSVIDGLITVQGPGLGVSDAVDPTATPTPVQDAIDKVATAGGGRVIYPPTDTLAGSEIIQDTGPILHEDEVDHVFLSETTIEITGDGNDGWVFDNSRNSATPSTLNIISVDIIGRVAVRHQNGPTGNTGDGLIFESSLQNSKWTGFVNIRDFHGYGFYDNSSTYQTVIDGLHLANNNPRDSAQNYEAYFAAGGAPYKINYLRIGPYDDGSTYVRGVRFDAGADPHIGELNIGGPVGRAVNVAGAGADGVMIDRINYETNEDYGSVIIAVDRSQEDTQIGHITLYNPPMSIDSVYNVGGIAQGHYGTVTVKSSATITNHIQVAQDTVAPPNGGSSGITYAGDSSEVNNGTGGTLTEPIACLGDLTLVQ
jgi:hypothetical protein